MARPGRLRGKAILRGRERVDARRALRNRENYMSTPGRFKRDDIDTDQKVGFRASVDQTPVLSEAVRTVENIGKKYLPSSIDETPILGEIVRTGRNLGQKYLPSIWGGVQRGLGSLTNNLAQNEENERILGDAYSDKVRKEMMSPTDRAFYEKYMRIGDSKSGQEADYYYDEARKALENAQITRRVNYALGDQPFGFDTSAEAGTHNVDYGGLSDRLQSGLEGTKSGREFLSDVIPKGEALRDTGMIGDAAARIAEAQAEGRAGFATPEARSPLWWASPDDEYTINTGTPFEGWADEPQNILTPEDLDDEVTLMESLEPITPTIYQSRQGPLDIGPEEQELLMAAYTDPEGGDPRYRPAFAYPETDVGVDNWADYTQKFQGQPGFDEMVDNKNVLDNLDYSSNPYDAYSGFIRKNLPFSKPWTNVDPSEFQPGGKYHMDTIFKGGAYDQLTPDQIEELKRGVSKSTGLW